MTSLEAVATKPALFVARVKNHIRYLLATPVKPPPAAFTISHRFFTIFRQSAVTIKLSFLRCSWPSPSYKFRRKGSLDPRLLFVRGKESLVRTVCACVKNPVKLFVKFFEHGGVHVGSVRILQTQSTNTEP